MFNIANHEKKCKSKPQKSLHTSEWLSSKRPQITNVGEDEEKRELLYTLGGNVNWYRYYGKHYGGSLRY